MFSREAKQEILAALIVGIGVPLLASLITSPATRQALAMRAAFYGKRFCQANADFWQDAATRFAQAYNRARM